MSKVFRAALFCSLLVGIGMLFGVCAAFFARKYAVEQVKASRANRKQYATITQDDGWAK